MVRKTKESKEHSCSFTHFFQDKNGAWRFLAELTLDGLILPGILSEEGWNENSTLVKGFKAITGFPITYGSTAYQEVHKDDHGNLFYLILRMGGDVHSILNMKRIDGSILIAGMLDEKDDDSLISYHYLDSWYRVGFKQAFFRRVALSLEAKDDFYQKTLGIYTSFVVEGLKKG